MKLGRWTGRGGGALGWLAVPLAAALLVTTCSGPAGDAGGGAEGESTLERIRRRGVVRVGYANEAPYAYLDSRTGELKGEAPAIARHVLAGMGVTEVEGVLTEFGSLIPGLKARRFDIIAAGMYITPKRCREIAFSNPTYGIDEAFIVEAGNPLGLHSYSDVAENAEASVGVVAGAVELGYARAMGVPDDRIVVFPDAPSAVAGVQAGRVDAYGGTALTVEDLLAKAGDTGLERALPFSNPIIRGREARGYGAFGFRQGDEALLQEFNRGLAGLIGSPEHLELVGPYGFGADDLPGEITAEELCSL